MSRTSLPRWAAVLAGVLALVVASAVVARTAARAGAATRPATQAATRAPAAAPAATRADVIAYLNSIAGNHVVSGQHNKEPISAPAAYTDKVYDITGVYPGLWGSDFTFGDPGDRQTMIDEAKREWQAGSLVALMWHMCPPTQAEPCDWTTGVESDLTDAQWSQLITPGTSLYAAYQAELDRIVPYLQQLKDAGVPVLWRPLHEMNDTWAWWGGRPGNGGSLRLYQITHDYLVGKGLTNLIWVWNVKDVSTDVSAYYPGDSYVDVVTLDSWMSYFPSTSMYNAMVAVAGGKPMALAEVGRIPTAAQLAGQPRWTYFMCWSEYLTDPNYNTNDSIKATYYDPRILHQGDLSIGGGTAATDLALNRPAYASSLENSSYPASNAFDGNGATRWSSAWADPQWIYTDLGANHTVTGVTLAWEAAYASHYQIQVSTDGQSWQTVYENDAGDGGTDTISLPATTARYVKMYAWQRATAYGYSLWEFTVTGT